MKSKRYTRSRGLFYYLSPARLPLRLSEPNHVFFCIALITLLRIIYLIFDPLCLFADEAQYWDWSREPAFGYYSKPPMIAWLIGIITRIFGDSEAAIRLISPLLHAACASIMYLTAKRLAPIKSAWLAPLTYLLLPAVAVSSTLASTDPALLFFWMLATYILLRISETPDNFRLWVAMGFALGGGMLSKYNMLFWGMGALGYFITHFGIRGVVIYQKNIAVSLSIAFLLYAPNLYWNLTHHYVTFEHTKDISQLQSEWWHPKHFFTFFFCQMAVFGPLLFPSLFYAITKIRKHRTLPGVALLSWLTFIPLIAMLLLSLVSNAKINWAAPSYIAATLLLVVILLKLRKRWILTSSMVLHLVMNLVFCHYHSLADFLNIPVSYGTGPIIFHDPFFRQIGWRELGAELREATERFPATPLLLNDRKLAAWMRYYARPSSDNLRIWNPERRINHHYALIHSLDTPHIGQDCIYLAKDANAIKGYFKHIDRIDSIHIPLYFDYTLTYELYYASHFKGYEHE